MLERKNSKLGISNVLKIFCVHFCNSALILYVNKIQYKSFFLPIDCEWSSSYITAELSVFFAYNMKAGLVSGHNMKTESKLGQISDITL